MGEMLPWLGGKIYDMGWVDHAYGLRAFKRSNGEYMVLIEDDGFARLIMYRWCPDGNCKESAVSAARPGSVSPLGPARVRKGNVKGSAGIIDLRGRTIAGPGGSGLSRWVFGRSVPVAGGVCIVRDECGGMRPMVGIGNR
jgi:hypothetical protein